MELLKIDCSTLPSHFDLESSDNCFYWREYTARKGFSYSETNQLISNLKKCPSLKGTAQYNHKLNAIKQIACHFKGYDWSGLTLIPIPPSKGRNDPLYDNRLIQILDLAKSYPNTNIDYQELIIQKDSYVATHLLNTSRPSIADIQRRYTINIVPENNLENTLVIFDDILTKGTHFKAIQSILSQQYPDKQIVGLFIARTIHTTIGADEFENMY